MAFEGIGNDLTITMAAEAGQLQLNAFEPIIAHSLFSSPSHLAAACTTLAVTSLVLERGLLTPDELDEILQPEHLISTSIGTFPCSLLTVP